MALAYSTRFSRCGATRPGFGIGERAGLSSECSSHETNVPSAAGSGRCAPSGGIMPPRSLRTAFSQTGASDDTCARSIVSNVSPRRLQPLVVARDAVLIEERSWLGFFRRLGGGGDECHTADEQRREEYPHHYTIPPNSRT